VVVAGGGIGGMTTGLLLGSAGASVRLLERMAEPGAVDAGILLQPNGLVVQIVTDRLGRAGGSASLPMGTVVTNEAELGARRANCRSRGDRR
jgi:2-polyprenyl-6-methoxyphenol hydroxylase-like FAD-dependent oxidoreductase